MSLYDAYVAADGSIGWKAEASTRLREFLERKVAPAGRGVEWALENAGRAIERAFEGGLSLRHARGAIRALAGWIASRRAQEEKVDPELEALCLRILEHTRKEGVENYSEYLFTVEMKL